MEKILFFNILFFHNSSTIHLYYMFKEIKEINLISNTKIIKEV